MNVEIHVEVAGERGVHVFTATPENAVHWLRAFVLAEGDGMRIAAFDAGMFFWPWSDVVSCKVVKPRREAPG
jgi:hypothetical protein